MKFFPEHRLLICHQSHAKAYHEVLARRVPALKITSTARPEEALDLIPGAEILIAATRLVTDELLQKAKGLLWLASTSAGTDRVARNPNLPKTVLLTKGISHGEGMVEYVFAYILYFNRKLVPLQDNQRNRVWDRTLPRVRPVRLRGQTLGVLGLGSIGRLIAERGKQFGMKVLGMKRSPGPVENVDQVFGPDELDRLMPRVDVLVVVLPLTPETHHILGERQLRLMKEGVLLISIGRGKEIDEAGLVRVLQTKRIRAVLDVCETEPLPRDSELWNLENVIITPHISGITTPDEFCEEFIANYERWINGKSLVGLVDRSKGY